MSDVAEGLLADVTAQLVYRLWNLEGVATDKFAVLINVTNLATSTGKADVVWHVYTVAEV
jgi:hypothetical protein